MRIEKQQTKAAAESARRWQVNGYERGEGMLSWFFKINISKDFFKYIVLKYLTVCFALSFNSNVFAQITFSEKLQHEPVKVSYVQYDSLENINIKNVMSLIGQTLCYVGNTTELGNGWTDSFYSDKNCMEVYHAKHVITAFNENVVRTDYQAIVGRYFKVCEVYDYNMENEFGKIFRLQLVDESMSDTLYWKWKPDPQYSFSNFVALGYFEKMKQIYIGETMILKLTHYRQILQNGEKTDIIKGTKFKCIDIELSPHDVWSMRAILENERYGKIEAYFKELSDFSISDFYTQRHINACIKKYGVKYGKDVAYGQIDIGMTEAMVKDAYGKPNKINYTTYNNFQSEQWVYDYDDYMIFVYFKKGRVVGIQEQK